MGEAKEFLPLGLRQVESPTYLTHSLASWISHTLTVPNSKIQENILSKGIRNSCFASETTSVSSLRKQVSSTTMHKCAYDSETF